MTLPFSVTFTRTQRDILDAHEAEQQVVVGARQWARLLLALMGIMWLSGFIYAVVRGVAPWLRYVWLLFGSLFTWRFLVGPYIAARSLLLNSSVAEPVTVTLHPYGLYVSSPGTAAAQIHWTLLLGLHETPEGLLLLLSEALPVWLPLRVFASSEELSEVRSFLQSQVTIARAAAA